MMVTDFDRLFAREQAQRIYDFHVERGDDISNHFSEDLDYVESTRRGILTECAFAHEFGQSVDDRLHPDGDGGRDFIVPFHTASGPRPFVVQVKSKSVRVSWEALRASGTHLRVPAREIRPRTIYVFGIYIEPSDDAEVLRWEWGRTLIEAGDTMTYKNTIEPVTSYIRRFEDLRDLAVLKSRMV